MRHLKTLFILSVLVCIFYGCKKDIEFPVQGQENRDQGSLPKFASNFFVKDNVVNLLSPPSVNYFGNDYFRAGTMGTGIVSRNSDSLSCTVSPSTSIVTISDGTRQAEASLPFDIIRDKYFRIKGVLRMNDIPVRTTDHHFTIRAAFWLLAPLYSGEVYNNGSVFGVQKELAPPLEPDGVGLGFEIFTSQTDVGKIRITTGVNDYGASHEDPTNFSVIDLTKSQFESAYNNTEYVIDINPRYIELKIGTIFTKRIEHSAATPTYWFPVFSIYFLQDDGVTTPPQSYHLGATNVTFESYKNPYNYLIYPLSLGVVNYNAKRFSFDTKKKNVNQNYPTYTSGTLDGLTDKYYIYNNLEDTDIPLSSKNCIGFYRPGTKKFHLDTNDDGIIDRIFSVGNVGDIPILGNWYKKIINGKIRATVGVFRPNVGQFWLFDGYPGNCLGMIYYGQNGDIPIAGDWNNTGQDYVGVYRPSDARFWTTLTVYGTAVAYTSTVFGYSSPEPPPGSDNYYILHHLIDFPITGDWDNNGISDVGVYRVADRQFWFRKGDGSVSRLDFDDEGTYPFVTRN